MVTNGETWWPTILGHEREFTMFCGAIWDTCGRIGTVETNVSKTHVFAFILVHFWQVLMFRTVELHLVSEFKHLFHKI